MLKLLQTMKTAQRRLMSFLEVQILMAIGHLVAYAEQTHGLCRVDTKYIGGKKGYVDVWDMCHEYKKDRKAEWILYVIKCPVTRRKKSKAPVNWDWTEPYKHCFFVNAAWLDRLYLENEDRQIKLPISKDDGMMFGIAEAFEAGQAFEIDLFEARLKRN